MEDCDASGKLPKFSVITNDYNLKFSFAAFLGFQCPEPPTVEGLGFHEHRFYQKPGDCQRYFLCVNGSPRLHNCGEGNYYDSSIKTCNAAENVTTCTR